MHGCQRFSLPTMLGLALLMAGAAGSLGGCSSTDRHVFESTEARPVSVSLIDALDQETLWQMDVPPDHRLALSLARQGEVNGVYVSGRPATHMDWSIYSMNGPPPGEQSHRRRVSGDRLQLEGRPVRLAVEYLSPAQRTPTPETKTETEAQAEEAELTPPAGAEVEVDEPAEEFDTPAEQSEDEVNQPALETF